MGLETELKYTKEAVDRLLAENRDLRMRCGLEPDPDIAAWQREIERQRGVIRDLRAEIDRLHTEQDQEFRRDARYQKIRRDRDHYRSLVERLREVLCEWGEDE